MTALNAALLYIAINTLASVILGILVTRMRRKEQVSVLFGENNKNMIKAVRAHGNNTEYVPIALLTLLGLGMLNVATWIIHAMGIVLTVGRIAHARGLYVSLGVTNYRLLGQAGTWAAIVFGAAALGYYAVA